MMAMQDLLNVPRPDGMAPKALLRRRAVAVLPLLLWLPRVQADMTQVVSRLGVYLGPGCMGTARLQDFTAWLGRRPSHGIDFLSDHSWPELVKAATRSARCWQPEGLAMSFAVPMLPRNGNATLAAGSRGDYDAYFADVARVLVAHGFGSAVVRVGWEFNHNWFGWRADKDPQAFVVYWRRIVDAMRAVPGAKFRFDWCTGWSKGQIAPDEVYPGDAHVDIVGMDLYNTSWNPMGPEQRWALKLSAPFGLDWQKSFAAAHGKPVSFPEWGTGLRPDGRGGGDDAYFIDKMVAWLATSDLAYHNYWDFKAPDFHARLSDGHQPGSEAAFLKAFRGTR